MTEERRKSVESARAERKALIDEIIIYLEKDRVALPVLKKIYKILEDVK